MQLWQFSDSKGCTRHLGREGGELPQIRFIDHRQRLFQYVGWSRVHPPHTPVWCLGCDKTYSRRPDSVKVKGTVC
nr:MAG TPA: zinc finger protein [Caudoviricetes sp.]